MKQIDSRLRKLEQRNAAQVRQWAYLDLHQSAEHPDLWATSRDGSDLATLAEHESRCTADTILVCHYRTSGVLA